MARTTINLKDELFEKLKTLAEQANRSTPNLIETILMRYLDETMFVDELEMIELRKDKELEGDIKKSWTDYKKGKYEIV